MRQIEVFDGSRYLFTIMPSDDPKEVLREESRRYARLHTVTVTNGRRSDPVPVEAGLFEVFDEEDFDECTS